MILEIMAADVTPECSRCAGAIASCRSWSYRTAQRISRRIQQALEPRYNRKGIFRLTVAGVNQCTDLEEELLRFPKAPNDDTSDSAAYQAEVAQPPAGVEEAYQVQQTRRRLAENGSR
jgi:hypothetical protein